jgi:hypothetical protein
MAYDSQWAHYKWVQMADISARHHETPSAFTTTRDFIRTEALKHGDYQTKD